MLQTQRARKTAPQRTHTPPTCPSGRLPRVHTPIRSTSTALYALNPNDRLQSGMAGSVQLQLPPQLSAAEAFQQGNLAFGFSAGGLLFPVSSINLGVDGTTE